MTNPLSKERLESALELVETEIKIADFIEDSVSTSEYYQLDSKRDNHKTIQAALSFLINPVVTKEMIDAFIAERHASFAEDTAVCKFKAMMAELIR